MSARREILVESPEERFIRVLATAMKPSKGQTRIKLITDKKLLEQWNHSGPLIALYNRNRWSIFPVARVSGKEIATWLLEEHAQDSVNVDDGHAYDPDDGDRETCVWCMCRHPGRRCSC